ncbi:hypothetical protein C8E03_11548 [Lachnotalea glycerini]|uniref:DUF4181 domain-containing protein n=1 Tax=Lachnotalea glycerini TaxID=1763509 RepID=A0A318EMZ1_9FIRM|nr:DUF6442 family protein [Lachnotalea glycerini]PXV85695.1 hypothetical protein C8E03_11548 [Lachnotalea glycerini]
MIEKRYNNSNLEELKKNKRFAETHGSLAMKIALCIFIIINFVLKKSIYELILVFLSGSLFEEIYKYKYSKSKEDMIAIISLLIMVISIFVLYLIKDFD